MSFRSIPFCTLLRKSEINRINSSLRSVAFKFPWESHGLTITGVGCIRASLASSKNLIRRKNSTNGGLRKSRGLRGPLAPRWLLAGQLHKYEAVRKASTGQRDSICVYPTRPLSLLADFIRFDLRVSRVSLSGCRYPPLFLSLSPGRCTEERLDSRKAASKLVQIAVR